MYPCAEGPRGATEKPEREAIFVVEKDDGHNGDLMSYGHLECPVLEFVQHNCLVRNPPFREYTDAKTLHQSSLGPPVDGRAAMAVLPVYQDAHPLIGESKYRDICQFLLYHKDKGVATYP